MQIFNMYRMLCRTWTRLRPPRPRVAAVEVKRRVGLFSSPVGASLLTGSLASGINLLPMLCFHWDLFRAPFLACVALAASLTVLFLGPYFVNPTAAAFKRALRFAIFLTVLAAWPIPAFYGQIYFLAGHYYEINCVVAVFASALIGWHLARAYGTPRQMYRCALLGILGNAPKLAFDFYLVVLMRRHTTGAEWSKDALAFIIMTHVLGEIGVVTVPALLIESEMRRAANSSR
jgi:hypothetical protein